LGAQFEKIFRASGCFSIEDGIMRAGSFRLIALIGFLAIDFGLLTAATVYLFHGSSGPAADASASAMSTPPARPSGSTKGAANAPQAPAPAPVGPMPRAVVESPSPIRGSPRYIVCGTADRQGGAWLGTEGQGVWSYRSHGLQQYSIQQGLAEDGACALACDSLGRIWAGHEAHGVSIYNGHAWQNYDRFHGPGGSHVFAITTSPLDGDIWLATETGVARYSLKNDTWTHFDRSTGLPTAEVEAIAVDHEGDVFVALPDAGIAVAKPSDNFAHWEVTTGPDDVPQQGSGAGLPTPIVHALLVTHADVLYAGTTRGLARSVDHGATWSYLRGANWLQLLKGSYGGVPPNFNATAVSPLLEDWITSLAEDASGGLWVGYRAMGYSLFSGDDNIPVKVLKGKISVVVPLPNQSCVLGSVGDGATLVGSGDLPVSSNAPPEFASALTADQFPTAPKAISADVLDALRSKVEALAAGTDGVDYLTDDWETLGDWPGRYGTAAANLMAGDPLRETDGCSIALTTGPYRHAFMRYYETAKNKVGKLEDGLVNPVERKRTYYEHNDESYSQNTHPLWEEGPDLYVRIELPAGVHRVSLYFCNYEGHSAFQEWREFPLQVRRTNGTGPITATDDPILQAKDPNSNGSWLRPSETIEAELATILCRSYVPRFWYGVYKQFLVRGAGTYWIKVVRNYANACKINGVFIDRMDVPPVAVTDSGSPWPTPPTPPSMPNANPTLHAAQQLWSALDAAVGREGYAAVDIPYRTLAYQTAAANQADPALLANWRWKLGSWNQSDRAQFNSIYKEAAVR
jgi:hypothetical protein